MPQRHLDRLSALDASFLHLEGPHSHMHIGALAICEGPPPARDELVAHLEARLHLVPRYRQRLAHAAFDRGRPLWVDDPGFRIDLHVNHLALPAPGDREQLLGLVARIFSTALDRSRPLWELWFVEGLPDGHFALIFKSHHAVIDGRAGVDLASVVFDVERSPAVVEDGPSERQGAPPTWDPALSPGSLELVAVGVAGVAHGAARLARIALGAAARPRPALARARVAVDGVGQLVWETLKPAPRTPLGVPIGPHRRFAAVSCELADFKLVESALGGTVNDILLAVVTGALRRFLQSRGIRTDDLELRALVPVSLRAGSGVGDLGNRLAAMRAPLPVHIADPAARLAAIRSSMDATKRSRQRLGADLLASLYDFTPPALLAQASRLAFATRLFNLLVTNVPGPRRPLYVLGREMVEVCPIAVLPPNHALAVAMMSYNGQVDFGLLGDFDALPELDQLGAWVREELAQLVELARAPAPALPRSETGL